MNEDEHTSNHQAQLMVNATLLKRLKILEEKTAFHEEYIIKLEKALVSVAREAFK